MPLKHLSFFITILLTFTSPAFAEKASYFCDTVLKEHGKANDSQKCSKWLLTFREAGLTDKADDKVYEGKVCEKQTISFDKTNCYKVLAALQINSANGSGQTKKALQYFTNAKNFPDLNKCDSLKKADLKDKAAVENHKVVNKCTADFYKKLLAAEHKSAITQLAHQSQGESVMCSDCFVDCNGNGSFEDSEFIGYGGGFTKADCPGGANTKRSPLQNGAAGVTEQIK